MVAGLLNQPARIDQSLPSYLKENFTRARYSTIFPFSIGMSNWSTSAILRSLRLLVEVSMTSFATSSRIWTGSNEFDDLVNGQGDHPLVIATAENIERWFVPYPVSIRVIIKPHIATEVEGVILQID